MEHSDPLHRSRKLLAMAAARLTEQATGKLRGLLGADDPHGHVHEAWAAKEACATSAPPGRSRSSTSCR